MNMESLGLCCSQHMLLVGKVSSWWFQPIWKIFVKLDHFRRGENKTLFETTPPRLRFKALFWNVFVILKIWIHKSSSSITFASGRKKYGHLSLTNNLLFSPTWHLPKFGSPSTGKSWRDACHSDNSRINLQGELKNIRRCEAKLMDT